MLKLNASYSKKVPADEKFSSQSFLASVEVELPHGMTSSELQKKIHETFDLVKESVENEITTRTTGSPAQEPRAPRPAASRPDNGGRASAGSAQALRRRHGAGESVRYGRLCTDDRFGHRRHC